MLLVFFFITQIFLSDARMNLKKVCIRIVEVQQKLRSISKFQLRASPLGYHRVLVFELKQ